MPTHEQKEISQEFADVKSVENQSKRDAWRGLLIPAVGSAAFFATTMANVIKTWRKYGFPSASFTLTDKVLMSLPFIIFGLAMHEIVTNNGDAVTDAE